jgi:hypothetical protein
LLTRVFGLADLPRSSSIDITATHAFPSTYESSALAEEDGNSKRLEPVQLDSKVFPLNRFPLGSLGSVSHQYIATDVLELETLNKSLLLSVKKQQFMESTSSEHQHSQKRRPGIEIAYKKIIELTHFPKGFQ